MKLKTFYEKFHILLQQKVLKSIKGELNWVQGKDWTRKTHNDECPISSIHTKKRIFLKGKMFIN